MASPRGEPAYEWIPTSAGVAVGLTARVMRPMRPLDSLLPTGVTFIRAAEPLALVDEVLCAGNDPGVV